ncbi:hypothetical protein B0H16DRAFT_1721555 [Mycena metata]|uniref:Uncharacterized protein n=1 Tax=Mycena metata TaxID=1033252 RepID=A0AAD7NEC6_9AGAR|nr:hypothetical protein B0H16DRAFT_1721555 [Mycena metata]
MGNIIHEIVVTSPTADYVVHKFVATSLSTTPPGASRRQTAFTKLPPFTKHNHFHSAVNARLSPPTTTPNHDNKPRQAQILTYREVHGPLAANNINAELLLPSEAPDELRGGLGMIGGQVA